VGRLTGGIAHDFNNMLTVIVGNAELLAEELGGNELVEEVLYASRRASELTGQLLSFSRQRPLRLERVATSTLIRDLTAFLRRTLGEDVALELDVAEDLWPITTDRAQFETSLINLAVNARDAMPTGGRLTIQAHNQASNGLGFDRPAALAPGDYVVVRMRDTGAGMAPEVVDKIFEPFFTTKVVGKGTGLGLVTVFGFTADAGGHIEVTSEVGKGSTFTLFLPRDAAPAP